MIRHVFPRLAFAAAVISMSCVTAGCPDSTSNNPNKPIQLGVGSTFVSYVFRIDSLGVKVQGSDDTLTKVVNATGLSYGGKSDVMQWIETTMSTGKHDTSYLHYEQSNDASIAVNAPSGILWYTYPTSGIGKTTFPATDTTETLAGKPTHVTITGSAESVGSEYVPISSAVFSASKISWVEHKLSTQEDTLIVFVSHGNGTWWYAPSIGSFVRGQQYLSGNTNGSSFSSGLQYQLVRYTIK